MFVDAQPVRSCNKVCHIIESFRMSLGFYFALLFSFCALLCRRWCRFLPTIPFTILTDCRPSEMTDWQMCTFRSSIVKKKESCCFNNLHIYPGRKLPSSDNVVVIISDGTHHTSYRSFAYLAIMGDSLQQQCHVQIEPNWPINWYFMKTQTIAYPKNSHTLRSAASQVQLNRNMSEIKSAHHTTAATATPAPRIEVR